MRIVIPINFYHLTNEELDCSLFHHNFGYSRYTWDFELRSQHGVCFATLQYEDAEKILASLENGNSVTKEDLPQYALDELDKISISNNNDMDPFDG